MTGPDERIDIEVVMSDMTSPTAENVERKIKDIGDESETSSGKVEDLGVQTDKTGKSWRRFSIVLKRSRKDVVDAGTDVDKTKAKVKGLGDESEKTAKKVAKSTRSIKSSTGGLFSHLKKITRPLFTFMKWGLMADGIGFVATALKGLGAAGFAAVAGLSPLVGLLGLYPGVLATFGQSMAALKLSTAGVGAAIAVMSDPKATVEQYTEATKNLHAEQIKFAQSVATSTDVWKELRKEVGGRFFKNVGPLYLALTKRYQPLFNKHLKTSADIWNDLIHDVGDFLDSKSGMQLIGDVMENNNKAMSAGAGGMSSSLQLLLWTIRAAGPMVTEFAGDFTRMTTKANNWAKNNQDTMTGFFNRSYDLAERVAGVLGDTAVGLYNMGKLSSSLSKYMGKSTEEAAKNFREWTESKQGRKEIKGFFRDMKPIVRELALWVRDLSAAIGDVALDDNTFVKWSKGLRKDVLPMITDIIDSLQEFALPILIKTAETYSNLKESGVTGGVGRALSLFADAIFKISEAASKLPESTKNMLTLATGIYAGYKILNRGAIGKAISAASGGKYGNNGIQKVWVVNMGAGMGGPGGKGPNGVVAGGPGKHAAPRKITRPSTWINRGGPGKHVDLPKRGFGTGNIVAGVVGSSLMGSENKGLATAGAGITGAAIAQGFGKSIVRGGVAGLFAGAIIQSFRSAGAKNESIAAALSGSGGGAQMVSEYDAQLKSADKFSHMPGGGEYQMEVAANINAEFERLTNMTIPQYKKVMGTLPKDIQTRIETPGMETTMSDMVKLLGRYDMTPKEKQTVMRLLGADEASTRLRDIKAWIDAIKDKTVRINIERTQTLIDSGAGGIGKGNVDGFYYKGGSTEAGKRYMTGEMGPEAWIGKNGAIKMLGLGGPEIVSPGAGAVLTASATKNPFEGNAGDAPDWAVQAFQRATKAKGRADAGRDVQTASGNSYSLSVQVIEPQSEMDITRAVKQAIREIEIEKGERG